VLDRRARCDDRARDAAPLPALLLAHGPDQSGAGMNPRNALVVLVKAIGFVWLTLAIGLIFVAVIER